MKKLLLSLSLMTLSHQAMAFSFIKEANKLYPDIKEIYVKSMPEISSKKTLSSISECIAVNVTAMMDKHSCEYYQADIFKSYVLCDKNDKEFSKDIERMAEECMKEAIRSDKDLLEALQKRFLKEDEKALKDFYLKENK